MRELGKSMVRQTPIFAPNTLFAAMGEERNIHRLLPSRETDAAVVQPMASVNT